MGQNAIHVYNITLQGTDGSTHDCSSWRDGGVLDTTSYSRRPHAVVCMHVYHAQQGLGPDAPDEPFCHCWLLLCWINSAHPRTERRSVWARAFLVCIQTHGVLLRLRLRLCSMYVHMYHIYIYLVSTIQAAARQMALCGTFAFTCECAEKTKKNLAGGSCMHRCINLFGGADSISTQRQTKCVLWCSVLWEEFRRARGRVLLCRTRRLGQEFVPKWEFF